MAEADVPPHITLPAETPRERNPRGSSKIGAELRKFLELCQEPVRRSEVVYGRDGRIVKAVAGALVPAAGPVGIDARLGVHLGVSFGHLEPQLVSPNVTRRYAEVSPQAMREAVARVFG